jgi:hypothetical protein
LTRDNSRIPGHSLEHVQAYPAFYIIPRHPCAERCWPWLEIRFGSHAGQPRAYLTADYGHENPGTLVSLAMVDGMMSVTATDKFPPGSPTLSGQVTEMTPSGPIPLTDVEIWRTVVSGYRDTVTDSNGFYQIHGAGQEQCRDFCGRGRLSESEAATDHQRRHPS